MGFSFIVVTNQSGIARGIYNIDNYHHLNNWMINELKNEVLTFLTLFSAPTVQMMVANAGNQNLGCL